MPRRGGKSGEGNPSKPNKCMHPDCTVSLDCGGGRGLCNKHLQQLQYAVSKGRTTYAKEEAAGQCLPPKNKSLVSRRWYKRLG